MHSYERGWPLAFNMFIYPLDVPGMKRDDYERLEIFLFQLWLIEETENSVTLVPNEKVMAYYYSMYENGREYKIFSKNNHINIDINIIKEINADSDTYYGRILEIMKENDLDICYYSEPIEKLWPMIHYESYQGYIAESKFSKDGCILLTTEGIGIFD